MYALNKRNSKIFLARSSKLGILSSKSLSHTCREKYHTTRSLEWNQTFNQTPSSLVMLSSCTSQSSPAFAPQSHHTSAFIWSSRLWSSPSILHQHQLSLFAQNLQHPFLSKTDSWDFQIRRFPIVHLKWNYAFGWRVDLQISKIGVKGSRMQISKKRRVS